MQDQQGMKSENKNRKILVFIVVILGVTFLCSSFVLLYTGDAAFEIIPRPIHSIDDANYQEEFIIARAAPIDLGILGDILQDRDPNADDIPSRLTQVADKLSTPITYTQVNMTVTPTPPNPDLNVTSMDVEERGTPKGSTPTATHNGGPTPTLTPSPTASAPISTPTPTPIGFTPSPGPTASNTPVMSSTPTITPTPTIPSTSTPAPTQQPTINPKACKSNPKQGNYCTPTPSS